VTHFAWRDTERLKYLFPFWIDMAVPVFMIISGFVNTISFQKNHITTIDKAYTVNFLLGKLIRYSVPFLIIFLIEEIVFNPTAMSLCDIVKIGASFLSGGFGPGSYYYPIIIQFVFYFPVIFSIIRKYDFNGFMLCGFINLTYEVLKFSYGMNEGCYRLLVFRYTLLIAYGTYLAMGNYKRHKMLTIICMGVGIVYIILFKYIGFTPPITNFWTGTSLWACLFIIPISAPIIVNKISNCFIEILGRASYDIFLVQMVYYTNAGNIYKLVNERWLQLLINIIICVSLGVLFHYIETPFTAIIYGMAYKIWNNASKKHSPNI